MASSGGDKDPGRGTKRTLLTLHLSDSDDEEDDEVQILEPAPKQPATTTGASSSNHTSGTLPLLPWYLGTVDALGAQGHGENKRRLSVNEQCLAIEDVFAGEWTKVSGRCQGAVCLWPAACTPISLIPHTLSPTCFPRPC